MASRKLKGRIELLPSAQVSRGQVSWDGRSIVIEYRWAEGHVERLPALASDLIARRVAILVVGASDVGIRAAMSATKTIPIVFHTASDPVDAGFVESFSRPGGNVTGVAALGAEISGKRLELLHQAVPTATKVGLLVNPNNPRLARDAIERSKAAARQLGVQIEVMNAGNSDEIDSAMASAVKARVDALAISNDAYLSARSQQVAYLALRYRLPTIGFTRQDAQAGVLISFGSNFADNYRLIGGYVARILKMEIRLRSFQSFLSQRASNLSLTCSRPRLWASKSRNFCLVLLTR